MQGFGGGKYRRVEQTLGAAKQTGDGKIKANWRLPVSCCLHIVFRRSWQAETALTILSACFSTLLCTSLPLSLEISRVRAHRSAMSDDASNLRIRPRRSRD